MAKRVGTWWIRDGLNERRDEAQGFGKLLEGLSSFDWTQDRGDAQVVKKDFVETSGYSEKVDHVDVMFMCSHGSYNPGNSSTWGRAFAASDGVIRTSDTIRWGKGDLEHFSSHACRLLYHSPSNSVGRWIPAFERLHYMFGFHTVSYSGTSQKERGSRFALYATFHLWVPFFSGYNLRTAWKKANVEVEGSSVKWAYLRANGETSSGVLVNTYNEKLGPYEPRDPVEKRTFWTARGSC
ncbi:MAG: hypothetical protein HXS48_27965 [Theionarchaea archaeon]|nr:hypothetical protein [Theionarchaea archaeon]